MAVVRGDRIGDSRKLSACTPEQQDAYARLVATIPDDFGRFRVSYPQIVAAMYPRLEDPRAIGRAARRWKRFIEAFEEAGLLQSWEQDGVNFCELYSWHPRKNPIYHRTPEPPWAGHEHTGWCLSSAITRSREYKLGQQEVTLTLQLKELRERKGGWKAGWKGGGEAANPSLPFTPSPPLPPSLNNNGHGAVGEVVQEGGQKTSAPADGAGALPATHDHVTATNGNGNHAEAVEYRRLAEAAAETALHRKVRLKERQLIESWRRDGIALPVVLRVLEPDPKESRGVRQARTLHYYSPGLAEEHSHWQRAVGFSRAFPADDAQVLEDDLSEIGR